MKTRLLPLAGILLVLGLAVAGFSAARAQLATTIDFEGLAEGSIVSEVSDGSGMHGEALDGLVKVFGNNPRFPGQNAAMIFDATCTGGCSGQDRDLFGPDQGNVLIISEDMDSSDPDDEAQPGARFNLNFRGFAAGTVRVESLVVGDVDEDEAGGEIRLYQFGLPATVIPLPITGNGVYTTVEVGMDGVYALQVRLKGSAAIDDIQVSGRPPLGAHREVLYMSTTDAAGDNLSSIYRVNIDEVGDQADVVLLPNGVVPYDHVDALAATASGDRIYFVDDGPRSAGTAKLAYYDVFTATIHEVGVLTSNGTNLVGIDQAAFSPENLLYITHKPTSKLFVVDTATAEATEVGQIVNQATGTPINLVDGADIAITARGEFFLYANSRLDATQRGLYKLDVPDEPGAVNATRITAPWDEHPVLGMAVRANGYGDLVAVTRLAELHIVDRLNGAQAMDPLPLFLDDVPFEKTAGDMSVGMLELCNSPASYWLTNPWDGMRITIVGVVVDETLGKEILGNASPDNFSGMVAQLVAAKLNVNNSGGLEDLEAAESWLADQGLVDAGGNLIWDKAFESAEQQDQAELYTTKLADFNNFAPCR